MTMSLGRLTTPQSPWEGLCKLQNLTCVYIYVCYERLLLTLYTEVYRRSQGDFFGLGESWGCVTWEDISMEKRGNGNGEMESFFYWK